MSWLNDLFKSRKDKIREQAHALQMSFYEEPDPETVAYLKNFSTISKGRGLRYKNVLHQRLPHMDVHILDYYADKDGNGRQRICSVCWIESTKLQLPHFLMRPEHLGHSILKAFGQKDINFDTFPGFSHHYWLRGQPENDVRYLMTDEFLKYFSVHTGWYLESFERSFILYKKQKGRPEIIVPDLYKRGLNVHELLLNRGTGRLV